MILRKPYAFLIKHFRLIHAMLAVCIGYLLYKNYSIYSFLHKFILSGDVKVPLNSTDSLFNLIVFILPWLMIVLLIVLLVILFRKKKPTLFYIINIIICIFTIVMDRYLYSTILYVETNIAVAQTIKLAQDFAFILVISEFLTFVIVFIRATGLDLKKFDFGKDLIDLDLKEEDNEEFELEFKFDSSVLKRGHKKNLRYLRYFYIEHKFIINVLLFMIVMAVVATIFITKNIYEQHYNEKDYFSYNGGTMGIINSYVTSRNSKGSNITGKGKTLLILDSYMTGYNDVLNLARTELHVGDQKFYPISDYANQLLDFGETYKRQMLISGEEYRYLLCYLIPSNLIHEEMYFEYLNDFEVSIRSVKPNYIKTLLNPMYMDNKPVNTIVDFNTDVLLEEKSFLESTMNINKLTLANEFVLNYNYCLSKDDCYKSKEYIKPVLNTNYDKVLLKVVGTLNLDSKLNNSKIIDLYSLITYFGKITYVIEDKEYTINSFTKVEPSKVKQDNTYYLEVDKEILKAEQAYFSIRLREKEYRYYLIGAQ